MYEMLTTYCEASRHNIGRFICNTTNGIPCKYSANNLSKQLSQIDNTFWGRSYCVVEMFRHHVRSKSEIGLTYLKFDQIMFDDRLLFPALNNRIFKAAIINDTKIPNKKYRSRLEYYCNILSVV